METTIITFSSLFLLLSMDECPTLIKTLIFINGNIHKDAPKNEIPKCICYFLIIFYI